MEGVAASRIPPWKGVSGSTQPCQLNSWLRGSYGIVRCGPEFYRILWILAQDPQGDVGLTVISRADGW